MTSGQFVLLSGAGLLAGIIGSAGGTASLISYPALLAAGLPPLAANITSAVAFVAPWPGSALSSRPELAGQWPWLRRWALPTAAGSAAGAGLLLVTPAAALARVVPFLLAFAALALLAQPAVTRWLARRSPGGHRRLLLPGGLAAAAVYDGYWGRRSRHHDPGLLMIGTSRPAAQCNALKNMLPCIADVACCAVFVAFWRVDWTAVAPMAAGSLAGGLIGPALTRR
ncbi:MAG TPA: sulfite exporter TauE/SafE family protein [Streptosporangiaceae bacterium]|jgi:hypothetical protein